MPCQAKNNNPLRRPGHLRALAAKAAAGVLLMAALALGAQPAAANLRAPITRHAPSGALRGPGQGLSVVSESLRIQCGGDCAIKAVYHVRAREAGSRQFEFILPRSSQVTVKTATSSPQAHTGPFVLPERESPGGEPRFITSVPLAKATFQAVLQKGGNELAISYQQPWGQEERKFEGYFSGWKSARVLRYELWPLKEWRLAKEFSLRIRITVSPEAAAGQKALLLAYPTRAGKPVVWQQVPAQRDHQGIAFNLDLGRDFPDRLEILLGPEDILPGGRP